MTRLTGPTFAATVAALAFAAVAAPAAAQGGQGEPAKPSSKPATKPASGQSPAKSAPARPTSAKSAPARPTSAKPASGKPAAAKPPGKTGPGKTAPARRAAPARPDRADAFRVDRFSPESGRPGTRVTIEGRGFTRTTSVQVGGKDAVIAAASPTEIVIEVPAITGDAPIALRKPGRPGELVAGTFHLGARPTVQRMAPTSGRPGERVELTGRGFERGDTWMMAGRSLEVAEWTPERVVVAIPEGARSDFISLSRAGSQRARTPVRFRILPERPAIARFVPAGGPPGTRVRITGSGFSPRDRVLYGSIATPVLGRGAGWVDVDVPRRARRAEPFRVRSRAGNAASEQPFALDLPPVVTGFSPRRGPPGTQLDVRGDHFLDGDWVSLAGKRLPIVTLTARRISVTVPIGSDSGDLVVGRERHATVAVGRFEVMNPPTLTAFTPTRGEPGTRVTLSGTHLDAAAVFYGRERVAVRARVGDTSIAVEIPRAARSERFRVTTPAGTAESPQPFQVQYYTVIEDARPRSGVPGTTVVLRGRHLDKAGEFYIGSTRLELVARDNTTATCRVPDGARTAPVAWTSFGRRDETPWRFEVLAGPVILQFQPTDGPPGTEIVIRGDHIDWRTAAYFGRQRLRVVRVTPPREIAVQLPRGAAGSDHLYLEGLGARARSEQTFQVKVAPVIAAAEPPSARPGEHVTVRGRWFTDATEILFGKVRSRVVRRDVRGGSIVVEVPRELSPGPHMLSARADGLVSEQRRPFVVLAPTVPGPDQARDPRRPGPHDTPDHRQPQ
ncbi:MAG TPA: IPT/TIG domain-containing protein [Kofleriaceae bacterium]|nr:IPT/TIG domain-containing protein [Kofleriaceae bacterium]